MTTPEGRVQNAAIRYAIDRGCEVKRNYMRAGAARGWPDTEFFCPGGRVLLIEFKAPGGTVSKFQAWRIKKLRELGHYVAICDDIEDAKRHIDAAIDS